VCGAEALIDHHRVIEKIRAAIAGWLTHHAGHFESAEEWVSDKAVSF
jgi:hypothetical protein